MNSGFSFSHHGLSHLCGSPQSPGVGCAGRDTSVGEVASAIGGALGLGAGASRGIWIVHLHVYTPGEELKGTGVSFILISLIYV